MALKASTKVETNVYEVEVTLEGEAVAKAAQDAYLKAKKNITIPGFRKGKAPRQIIEKLYGENFFYEEGLENLLQGAVSDAIDEAGLDIVDNPRDLEVKELGKDGAEFTFKVTVKPEVEIGEYKGLKAEKASVRVESAEIDAELQSLRNKGAREISVEDRAAQKDDIADIDFEGFVDGVAFDGGKGEHFALTLGSGQFIPGFEDQVIGHNIGEEFDVNVKFPEEYTPELAGKDATFKVKLHGLKVRELPELDDEFAKDVSEDADTLDDLKKSIKEEIRKKKQDKVDADFRTKIYDQLIDLIKAEIPEVMFEKRVQEDKETFSQRVGMQGIDLETYLMYIGMEMDTFMADLRVQAERNVKIGLALEKIAELEKLEVTEEDYEAEYNKYAEMYNIEVERIKMMVPQDTIKGDLLLEKATKFVIDNAVAEKPAKKTAAKKTTKKKADEEKKEDAE